MGRYGKPILAVLCLALLFPSFGIPPARAAANDDYFYSQLDAAGQEVYTKLLASVPALREGKPITIDKSGSPYSTARGYMASSTAAVRAFDLDHSEIFWLADWQTSARSDGGGYVFQLELEIQDSWGTHGSRSISADEATVAARVSELAAGARGAGTRYHDQLLYLHDQLTAHNLYNEHAAGFGPIGDSTPWEAIGALDESLSPVCEGYARAFKLVCDQLGIPCILASGGDHMWDCVQMEDGKWYAVDVTYDDPVYTYNGQVQNKLTSGGESHRYFLVGSQDFQDHSWDRDWSWPVLSASSYSVETAGTAPQQSVPSVAAPAAPATTTPIVVPSKPSAPAVPVTSVSTTPSDWAAEEVQAALRESLVPASLRQGYQGDITRVEFAHLAVALLERIEGKSAGDLLQEAGIPLQAPFQDTQDPSALAAYALGIVQGRSQSTFDPDGTITRQEAAVMLTRAAMQMGAATGSAKQFQDSGQFASWAVDAIAYVSSVCAPDTERAVMGGVGGGRFSPLGTYTREQAIVSSYRLFRALAVETLRSSR